MSNYDIVTHVEKPFISLRSVHFAFEYRYEKKDDTSKIRGKNYLM